MADELKDAQAHLGRKARGGSQLGKNRDIRNCYYSNIARANMKIGRERINTMKNIIKKYNILYIHPPFFPPTTYNVETEISL